MNRRAFISTLAGAAVAPKLPVKPHWIGVDLASGPDLTIIVKRVHGGIFYTVSNPGMEAEWIKQRFLGHAAINQSLATPEESPWLSYPLNTNH